MHDAAWSVSQQLMRQSFVAIFMFVLARRVSPYEFGLIGVANIVNNFLVLFLELGFCAVVVQRKRLSDSEVFAASFLNVVAGTTITLAAMILAKSAARLINAPEAAELISTLSLSFLITSAVSPRIALAQRNFQFRELALRDFLAQSIAALIGIAFSIAGFGVWSVVANSLCVNLLFGILVWSVEPGAPVWGPVSRVGLRSVWRFGLASIAHSAVKLVLRTSDSFVVGLLFGPEKLGLYNFAQRVTNAPTKAIQFGLSSYLFPKASSMQQNRTDLNELFLVSFKLLNLLVLGSSVLLLTLGSELIPLLFGSHWAEVVPIIWLLIPVQLLSPLIVPVSELAKAANFPHRILAWSALTAAGSLSVLAGASVFGFETGLIAYVASFFVAAPFLLLVLRGIITLRPREFIRRVSLSYLIPISWAILFVALSCAQASKPVLIALPCVLCMAEIVLVFHKDADARLILNKVFKKTSRCGPRL